MGLPHIVDVLKGTATRVKGGLARALWWGFPTRSSTPLVLVGRRQVVESTDFLDRGVLVGADGCVERGLLGYRVSITVVVVRVVTV